MNLVPYEKSALKRFYKPTKIYKLLCEFRDSDFDCVKVDGIEERYKSAASAQASFHHSIKRFKMAGIVATMREGSLYLIKTGDDEE